MPLKWGIKRGAKRNEEWDYWGEGTLKKFLAETPLDSYVAMKTGSMRGIQCYAGYKLDDDYMPTHVIVIIMNDIEKSRDKAKREAEKMLLSIFNQ